MTMEIRAFIIRLFVFMILLFAIHMYLIFQFFEGELFYPIWSIYVFNGLLVFLVYMILNHQTQKGGKNIIYILLILTILKMVLAVVFLLPLFFGKSNHSQLEIFNFFIPYFLLLAFEILSINKFLQKL